MIKTDLDIWRANETLRDQVVSLQRQIEQLKGESSVLVERSVAAMTIAEEEMDLWKGIAPECPMLEAVKKLRQERDQLKTQLAELHERAAKRIGSLEFNFAQMEAKCLSLAFNLKRIVYSSDKAVDCGDHCSNSCMWCEARNTIDSTPPSTFLHEALESVRRPLADDGDIAMACVAYAKQGNSTAAVVSLLLLREKLTRLLEGKS